MRLKSLIIAILTTVTVVPGIAKSPKRGVSENEFRFKAQMEAIAPGVSWYYNWGPSVGRYLRDETAMEFVPMCWNGNYDAEGIRSYVKEHPEVRYLLGFNEPNFSNQANMTPAEAAARWGDVRALAAELGLQLVAPALNYSPNPPYHDPVQWMDEFVALVGDDAFDFTAVHSYGGTGVMKELAEKFHDKYGKPIWVTEFCYWPEEGNPNSTVQPDAQISTMMQSLEWLEKTPWIFRYAWFKPVGESSAPKGPNFGLLITGHGEDPRELSEQGIVYENMWEFDIERYFATGEWIPASHYISQYGCLLGSYSKGCSENPEPIEISRFNGGAWVEYQFEIPHDATYTLTLMVSGQGEPRRFDPCVEIDATDGNGNVTGILSEPRTFTLTGSDDEYTGVDFAIGMKAGRQTIRVADANPAQPSGIRIAALRIDDTNGIPGVSDACSQTVDVFGIDGTCLRTGVEKTHATDGLPRGIYITGGEKVIIR